MYAELVKSLTSNRLFIWSMATYDLKTLNKGSILGLAWVMINPIIRVSIYVIIVSFIFGQRLGPDSGPFDYGIYVLSGMIPWQILTKALEDSPSILRNRQEFIKQVVFPVETLPLTSIIVGSFGSLVSLMLLLALALFEGSLSVSILLLPIPFLLLVLFILGVSWLFSVVGVLFKDLREMVGVLLSLMVYASPVIASEEMVGATIWKFILMNPLSHIVICFRDVFYGDFNPTSWIIFSFITLISLLIGGFVIARAKIVINEYI